MNNDNKIVCSHKGCGKFPTRKLEGFYFCETHAKPLLKLFKILLEMEEEEEE